MLRALTLWVCFLFGGGALAVLVVVMTLSVIGRRHERREAAATQGYAPFHSDDDTYTWITEQLQADVVVKPDMITAGPAPAQPEEEDDVHWSGIYGEAHPGPERLCRYCQPAEPRYEDLTDTDVLQRVSSEPWVISYWGMDAKALTDVLFDAACRPALPA